MILNGYKKINVWFWLIMSNIQCPFWLLVMCFDFVVKIFLVLKTLNLGFDVLNNFGVSLGIDFSLFFAIIKAFNLILVIFFKFKNLFLPFKMLIWFHAHYIPQCQKMYRYTFYNKLKPKVYISKKLNNYLLNILL